MKLGSGLNVCCVYAPIMVFNIGWLSKFFYNGVTQPVRSTIDAAAGGTFMNKTKDKAYNLIDKMALNSF